MWRDRPGGNAISQANAPFRSPRRAAKAGKAAGQSYRWPPIAASPIAASQPGSPGARSPTESLARRGAAAGPPGGPLAGEGREWSRGTRGSGGSGADRKRDSQGPSRVLRQKMHIRQDLSTL